MYTPPLNNPPLRMVSSPGMPVSTRPILRVSAMGQFNHEPPAPWTLGRYKKCSTCKTVCNEVLTAPDRDLGEIPSQLIMSYMSTETERVRTAGEHARRSRSVTSVVGDTAIRSEHPRRGG